MSKILSAVAWPYANGPRHIGHVAGFGVPSDVFSRYMRMAGHDVLMVSGTDEHGTPILVAAYRPALNGVTSDAGAAARRLARARPWGRCVRNGSPSRRRAAGRQGPGSAVEARGTSARRRGSLPPGGGTDRGPAH